MDSESILFSIVVPVYNVEQFLDKCVRSILEQTYTKFELILVDDGSTDSSGQMCDQYEEEDCRITVIHKKNGGLVSARKAGVSVAKGDYAVCVDSDDWIDKKHLQELSRIVHDYSSPDIICFGHYEVSEGKKNFIVPFRKGLYEKSDLENEVYPQLIRTEIATAFPPAIWSKAYKMDLYRSEQLLVDDRIKIGEDAACTIPCLLRANTIYIIDKALYYYRRNNASMTKNKKPFSWDVPELIELHLRKRVETNEADLQQQISRRTVHALINVVKTQFYRDEKYRAITKDIQKELDRPIYRNALKDSKFKRGSTISICRFFLTHNIYFPFCLLSKIR